MITITPTCEFNDKRNKSEKTREIQTKRRAEIRQEKEKNRNMREETRLEMKARQRATTRTS